MTNIHDTTFDNLMEQVFNDINAVGTLAGMDETKEYIALLKSFSELSFFILELDDE